MIVQRKSKQWLGLILWNASKHLKNSHCLKSVIEIGHKRSDEHNEMKTSNKQLQLLGLNVQILLCHFVEIVQHHFPSSQPYEKFAIVAFEIR